MNWSDYHMGFAQHAATKSKDTTKVGAALVSATGNAVLLTGFNGLPIGVKEAPERRERPAKYLWTSHAEANVIAQAAREGIRTKGCTMYTTHAPCSGCARAIIQAGIECVVIGDGLTSMPEEEFDIADTMFAEAGVEVHIACAVKGWTTDGTRPHDGVYVEFILVDDIYPYWIHVARAEAIDWSTVRAWRPWRV